MSKNGHARHAENRHRRRQGSVRDTNDRRPALPRPAELGVLLHIDTVVSSEIIATRSSAAEDDRARVENFHFRFSDFFGLAWRRTLAQVLAEIFKPANNLRTGANRDLPITNRSEKIVDGFWEKRRGWGVFSFQLRWVARRMRRQSGKWKPFLTTKHTKYTKKSGIGFYNKGTKGTKQSQQQNGKKQT